MSPELKACILTRVLYMQRLNQLSWTEMTLECVTYIVLHSRMKLITGIRKSKDQLKSKGKENEMKIEFRVY